MERYEIRPESIANNMSGWVVWRKVDGSTASQRVALFPEVIGAEGRAFTHAAEFVKVAAKLDQREVKV